MDRKVCSGGRSKCVAMCVLPRRNLSYPRLNRIHSNEYTSFSEIIKHSESNDFISPIIKLLGITP